MSDDSRKVRVHPDGKIRWRAIWFSLLLIPINSYWISMAVVWRQVAPTKVSLFINVVFILFLLASLNQWLKWLVPKFAFSQGELLIVYIMLSLASAVSGGDLIRLLVPIQGVPFWFATPENEWAELFHRYIPQNLAITNRQSLAELFEGESSLYRREHLMAWWRPEQKQPLHNR